MILIIILFIIFIFISIIFYFSNNKKEIEKLTNCNNKLLGKRSNFCTWNINAQKCYCSFQPGLVRTNFPQNPNCCDRQCNLFSECVKTPDTK